MRPGSEGGEPGRRREAGPVGTDALDVAQEPGELNGKGSREVGVDGPGTMWHGHGLLAKADASKYPRAEGCRRCQESVPQMVRRGAPDAATDRDFARVDGAHSVDYRGALGGNLGPLGSRSNDHLHGRTEPPVLSREAASKRRVS